MYKMKPLGYAYSDVYPYIDGYTMYIHYNKHYKGYLDKLNESLKDYPVYFNYDINSVLYNYNSLPEELKDNVRKYGGGYANHNLYWESLIPVYDFKEISEDFKEILDNNFGSYDNFLKVFKEEANDVFGSGWVFLVIDNCSLKIMSTKNQNSPLIYGYVPILALDLWEHAFYLHYQNRRSEYIDNFFEIINWDNVFKAYKNHCDNN